MPLKTITTHIGALLKGHVLGVFILGVVTGLSATALWEYGKDIFDNCEKVVAIKELDWTEGNKTKFCQRNEFDGVFSLGEYRAGGYCYKGDAKACKRRIYPGLD